jgi:hypothetical protein
MNFHKVATLDETHTFSNITAKCCIVSPTATVFKRCTVLHSATLHEVLPISEFKMQTAYCNTSRRVVYFEIQNTTSHAYFLVILEHTHGD